MSGRSFPQLVNIPTLTNAWQMIYNCQLQREEKTAIAIAVFYLKWAEYFGDDDLKVFKSLSTIMIEWNSRQKFGNGYDINGTSIFGGCFTGVTLTPGYIWVQSREGQMICETSLMHELVHVSLWATSGEHGDPDHEGRIYKGLSMLHSELVNSANSALCRLGI